MEKKLKRTICILSVIIVVLIITLGLQSYYVFYGNESKNMGSNIENNTQIDTDEAIDQDNTINKNNETETNSAVAEETSIKEEGFGHKDIANFNIAKILSNELDITNEVDIDWLHDSIQNSEVTALPSPRIALILDIKIVFEDNTSAQLELLSDDVYCLTYNDENYYLKSVGIAEWLLTLS